MRPASIVRFQWLYLAYIAVSLAVAAMGWNAMMARVAADPRTQVLGSETVIGLTIVNYVVLLLLWYFVAFRRSNVARWIATLLFLAALAIAIRTWSTAGFSTGTSNLMAAAAMLLNAVAILMLFRPDAAAWFKGDAAADPAP